MSGIISHDKKQPYPQHNESARKKNETKSQKMEAATPKQGEKKEEIIGSITFVEGPTPKGCHLAKARPSIEIKDRFESLRLVTMNEQEKYAYRLLKTRLATSVHIGKISKEDAAKMLTNPIKFMRDEYLGIVYNATNGHFCAQDLAETALRKYHRKGFSSEK